MDSPGEPWDAAHVQEVPVPRTRDLQDSIFFKIVFSITFALAFLFLLISIYGLFRPANPSDLTAPSPFYFFVLLIVSPIFSVSTYLLDGIMVALYLIFFVAIAYDGFLRRKERAIDNPVVYYGGLASFALLMSIVITLIEMALGIQIGGTTIETGIEQHPYLSYVQLIYAPFAEELGFRIIPLGLLSMYLVARRGGGAFNSIASFVIPGPIRKKLGIRLTGADYALIIITSLIFGFAHYFFGAWDPGKIISAAFVGFVLAFGYIKFGIFVDIPIHWFFNGFSSVYIIMPPMLIASGLAVLWASLSGAIALVFLILVWVERKKVRQKETSDSAT